MRIIFFALVAINLTFLASCGNIHSPYYTSPTGAGYNQQVIGAKCAHCSRQMNISWNQYNNMNEVSCPYCGRLTNTKQGAATFTYDNNNSSKQQQGSLIVDSINAVGNYHQAKADAYRSSLNSNKCEYRSYTTTVGSKTMYCTQDSFCNINCF